VYRKGINLTYYTVQVTRNDVILIIWLTVDVYYFHHLCHKFLYLLPLPFAVYLACLCNDCNMFALFLFSVYSVP